MKLKNMDNYQRWIESISCRYPEKIWHANLKESDVTLKAASYEQLYIIVEEYIIEQLLWQCADALMVSPEILFKNSQRLQHLTDGKQACAIAVKELVPNVHNGRLARKIGWSTGCMVVYSLKNRDVKEIGDTVKKIFNRLPVYEN